jgi:ectoine hydroxylase-related dioxygenase (phytanoyl-CoA dioxygenase family)
VANDGALDSAQRAAYGRRGYHFPVTGFSASEAAALQRRFLGYWQSHQDVLKDLLPRERVAYVIDTHLFLRWVHDIAVQPRVLDAIEGVLGPDILVWSSQWFAKMPHDRAFVSWHQDATYWGLTPPNVCTGWIALSVSDTSNGCLRVVPGTHRGALLPQRETHGADNMLSRGQEIAVEVDESQAVELVLRPGELSLHHVGIVHGSGPNDSDVARIGLAVRYISPDVIQQGAQRDIAVLARGHDRYGHFDLVEPPERDLPYGASETHRESLARKRSNLGGK